LEATKNVLVSFADDHFYASTSGELKACVVCFRNEATEGQANQAPHVHAHVIYRDAQGKELADIAIGVWLEQDSSSATLKPGHKMCLIIALFNPENQSLQKLWFRPHNALYVEHPQLDGEDLVEEGIGINRTEERVHALEIVVQIVTIEEGVEISDAMEWHSRRASFEKSAGTNLASGGSMIDNRCKVPRS
jgi:hypothetical protein